MWQIAAQEFRNINYVLSVQDKLECFLKCIQTIVYSITICSPKKAGPGADDTFPILIFIILKSNPSQIYSNMNYIKLFMNGYLAKCEIGYVYT